MEEILSDANFLILSDSEDLFPESDLLLNTLIELKGQCFYQLFKGKLIYLFYLYYFSSETNETKTNRQ